MNLNQLHRSHRTEDLVDSPNLGIAHQPLAETHGDTVSSELSVAVLFGNGVHVRGCASLDGIPFETRLVGDAPPIMNAVERNSCDIRS